MTRPRMPPTRPRTLRAILRTGLLVTAIGMPARASADGAPDLAERISFLEATIEACASAPDSAECDVHRVRAAQIVSNALAEAGNTRDRDLFLEPVRKALGAQWPEIRGAAVYALAKLGPDETDTPQLRALALDPFGLVRAGAWSALSRSQDPEALLVKTRFSKAYRSDRLFADPPPFDSAALSLTLPAGAQYLWYAQDLRKSGELQFLADGSPDDVAAHFTGISGREGLDYDDAIALGIDGGKLQPFQNEDLFEDQRIVVLDDGQGASSGQGVRLAVAYRDLAFDRTGFTILWVDGRDVTPPPTEPVAEEAAPPAPMGDAEAAVAFASLAGIKPDASPEDTAFFMAVVAANGSGAEDYLELFPDGAYAAEAKAIADGPRLELDTAVYGEGDNISVRLFNMPPESSVYVELLSTDEGYSQIASVSVDTATGTQAIIDPYNVLAPGIYIVRADIETPSGRSTKEAPERSLRVVGARAQLALDKQAYAPGEAITIAFNDMSGDANDYVATAKAGAPNTDYLQYVYTKGAKSGTAILQGPTEPGSYEVRAFFREDESIIRGSLPFAVSNDVELKPVSIKLDKTTYAPGETITITYDGMFGAGNDYLSTAESGAPNTQYINYVYTAGNKSGSATLKAPDKPGSYEIRAFFREDESELRGHVPFTVK